MTLQDEFELAFWLLVALAMASGLAILLARLAALLGSRISAREDVVIVAGPLAPRRWRWVKPSLLIGRTATCDVVLSGNDTSRRHATLKRHRLGYHLAAHSGANPIKVRGRSTREALLKPGERFTIGKHTLIVLPARADTSAYPDPGPLPLAGAARPLMRMDDYVIDRQVGPGGQVLVWHAYDRLDKTEVVIKQLLDLDDSADGRYLRAKFAQQLAFCTTLRHPYCACILGGDAQHQPPFLVERFEPGGTLRDRLRQGRGLVDTAAAIRILGQLCDALDYLRRMQVVHRDIKPSNVLFSAAGDAILSDYGLARIAASGNRTRLHMRLGTPAYMSPELAAGRASQVTHLSDQYQLAVTAFEMFAGRPVFEGTPIQLLRQHMWAAPPSLRQFRPDLAEHIIAAIDRALSKEPERRHAHPAAFARALGYAEAFHAGNPADVSGAPLPPDAAGAGRDTLKLRVTQTDSVVLIRSASTQLTRKLVNPTDTRISHVHGCITSHGGGWWLAEDAGTPSANGLFRNGDRITTPELLLVGDLLRLGRTELVVDG